MAENDVEVTAGNDSQHAIIRDGVASYMHDPDPEETKEWMDSFDGLLENSDPERARYLMLRLLERADAKRVPLPSLTTTDFVNTIPTTLEPEFPGDEAMEKRYRRWIRWNAAIMVHRAQRPGIKVGGHISTYASAAALYEVGFNHFFHGKDHPQHGDQIFVQGHASPASTPVRSWRADCPKMTWTASASSTPASRAACRPTRTRTTCRSSGSSRLCPWAWAR